MGRLLWLWQLIVFLHLLHFYSQVVSSSFSATATSFSLDQCTALLEFKKSFSFDISACSDRNHGIAPYPKTITWNKSKHCCSWDGVVCDKLMGNIVGLDLSYSCLQGHLHSNSTLFFLSHLQRLNLAHNDFRSSQIPSKFAGFTSLTHLNFSNSEFSGEIPPEISYLSKLMSIDFSRNQLGLGRATWTGLVQNLTDLRELFLDGVVMASIITRSLTNLSSSLTSLSLSDCILQGEIPVNIFMLQNLQELILSVNGDLTGYFPRPNQSNSLHFLDLSSTGLSGEVPDSVGNLKHLQELHLRRCNFMGSIPASLGNLTKLTFLDMSENMNLTGEIPSSFSNFEQLTYLDLSQNSLSGQIPDVFSNLSKLAYLSLSKNNLQGHLPPSAFQILEISYMDFSENKLEYSIPSQANGLSYLTYLLLYGNLLSGTIPFWVFALPSLLIMDFSFNQLSGRLFEFHPKSIELLMFADNKMYGSVPGSIFELVNLTVLDLATNNFSGKLDLDMFSNLQHLSFLCLSYNSLVLSDNSNVNYTLSHLSILSLSSCKLSKFPKFLGSGETLGNLDLSYNQIHGKIPKWITEVGKDSLYHLNLSHNYLTDVEQFQWKNVRYLDLSANLLQGPLPIPPPNVVVLIVSHNKFTGGIPPSFCNMTWPVVLDLSNNTLNGTIPRCSGNSSIERLSVLNLRMNSFHGTIPDMFGERCSLRNIDFNTNDLVGSLPQSLRNCKKLEILNVGNNKINDFFPHWLGTLPNLQVLVLRFNKFQGPIGNPQIKFPFPKLRIIDLSHNEFNGFLPTRYFESFKALLNGDENKVKLRYMGEEYYQDSVTVIMKGMEIELVKILTIFATIDFSNNHFRGEIMGNIGNLKSLKGLNFSHNSLTGHIPPSLGNLTNLEWLDLSVNSLFGMIPPQLVDMTFLAFLNLSENKLVGEIPRGNQLNTFQNDSYIGNSGLCGFPLSKTCDDDMAPEPPPSFYQDEDDSGSIFEFGWKVVLIGYGCGTLFGMAIGYIVFRAGKPECLVMMVDGRRHRKLHRQNRHSRHRRG